MKTAIIILALFSSTLLASTALSGEPELSTDLLYGEDCSDAHGGYFLEIMAEWNPDPDNNTKGSFTIQFFPTSPDMVLNLNLSLFSIPEGSKVISGEISRNFTDFSSYTEASWNLSGIFEENGLIWANITLSVLVPHDYPIHPDYIAFYSITLTYNLKPVETTLLSYLISLRWFDIDFTNRVLGYIAYTLMVVTSVIGMPGIPRIIKTKSKGRISSRRVRQTHRHLGYLISLMVAFHVLVSMLAPMWLNIIKLWILPTLYIPQDLITVINLTDSKLGIELGRWAGLLILITIVGGIDFSRVSRDWGRKSALFLQQLSYISLIAIALHTIMIGTFAREQTLFVVFTWVCLVTTFTIRIALIITKKERNVQSKQKIPRKEEIPIKEIIQSTEENQIKEKIQRKGKRGSKRI
ncbi:MAG: hypothetical protein ACTSQ9_06300 [Candidatus Hodarchaeales archaeon]